MFNEYVFIRCYPVQHNTTDVIRSTMECKRAFQWCWIVSDTFTSLIQSLHCEIFLHICVDNAFCNT